MSERCRAIRRLRTSIVVGIAYLVIGLFIYYRRGSAHKARHFYIFCLVSFVLCSFHYTGRLHSFDKFVYFANVAAGFFAPTIFLHFCLTFPEPRAWIRSAPRVTALYIPATLLFTIWVAITSGVLRAHVPLVELRWLLDRIWMPFLTLVYLLGGLVLTFAYKKAEDPIVRHQLKWLRNGTLWGIIPFALFYVLPYTLGLIPNAYLKLSVLSLGSFLLPWPMRSFATG